MSSKSLGPIPEKLRLKLYDMVGGVCESCGSNDLENNPHHIPYRSQPGSKNNVDHLIWLCRRCHRWAHRVRLGNEEYQYKRFREWYDDLPVHHINKWRNGEI